MATDSVTLVHALVDECRLYVHPVVLGRGARPFDGASGMLRLVETRPFNSGVVLMR